jgi:hypothetical protein
VPLLQQQLCEPVAVSWVPGLKHLALAKIVHHHHHAKRLQPPLLRRH